MTYRAANCVGYCFNPPGLGWVALLIAVIALIIGMWSLYSKLQQNDEDDRHDR